jgi:hypothetical protein
MPGQLLLATAVPHAAKKKLATIKYNIAGPVTGLLFLYNVPPSGYRIIAARVKRMAAADTLCC